MVLNDTNKLNLALSLMSKKQREQFNQLLEVLQSDIDQAAAEKDQSQDGMTVLKAFAKAAQK